MFLHANSGLLQRKQKPLVLNFSQAVLFQPQPMRHRPTDCRLQAAGEGVKQLDNKLVVWRTYNMEIQQPKDSRYVKNAGAVFNLSYHIVFCPKYRRKVLVGDVETRLKHILYATAQQYGVLIETMEVMPDHVHLFVTSDPTRCVAEIVNRLKGVSSRLLRQEFRHLVSKMPT